MLNLIRQWRLRRYKRSLAKMTAKETPLGWKVMAVQMAHLTKFRRLS